jgi:nicotinamidase-related amidase
MGNTALLVIDMMSSYDFDDADRLAESAADAVPVIADLVERARSEDVSVVYVNDNYGDWSSSLPALVERAKGGHRPDLVDPLAPDDGAAVVFKARHTVFYQTPLEYMLREGGIDRLVMTGQVTEQCILYSALDAYVRHFDIVVPRDAVAHIHRHLAEAALEMMAVNMDVDVCDAHACDLTGPG